MQPINNTVCGDIAAQQGDLTGKNAFCFCTSILTKTIFRNDCHASY